MHVCSNAYNSGSLHFGSHPTAVCLFAIPFLRACATPPARQGLLLAFFWQHPIGRFHSFALRSPLQPLAFHLATPSAYAPALLPDPNSFIINLNSFQLILSAAM